jgi:hypothetical protein
MICYSWDIRSVPQIHQDVVVVVAVVVQVPKNMYVPLLLLLLVVVKTTTPRKVALKQTVPGVDDRGAPSVVWHSPSFHHDTHLDVVEAWATQQCACMDRREFADEAVAFACEVVAFVCDAAEAVYMHEEVVFACREGVHREVEVSAYRADRNEAEAQVPAYKVDRHVEVFACRVDRHPEM